jgi:polysaccharide export outer membrane protein
MFDVLVQAGGLTEAAGNDAIVTRGETGVRAAQEESFRTGSPNPPQSFTLNIRKLVETGDDKANILLYPGDRVTVQRASLIYVMGAVARPGGYVLNESRQDVTVLKALAMAGDVTAIAKKKRITILRQEANAAAGKRAEIPVNYKAMVRGETADLRLQPDDILFVPESGGIKAWRTAVSSTVQVATGGAEAMMIYR